MGAAQRKLGFRKGTIVNCNPNSIRKARDRNEVGCRKARTMTGGMKKRLSSVMCVTTSAGRDRHAR